MIPLFKHRALASFGAGLAIFLCLTLTAKGAVAGLIGTAEFGYSGAFGIEPGATLGNNHQITVLNNGLVHVTSPGTGDLAGVVNFGDPGTRLNMPNINAFAPIPGFLVLSDGVSFDLQSLTIVSRLGSTNSAEFLNLSGSGILHAPTISANPILGAQWTWTGTSPNNKYFVFASTISAEYPTNNIPEPQPLALLGTGLLALVLVRRRINSRARSSCDS